jgi:hypothetical protein
MDRDCRHRSSARCAALKAGARRDLTKARAFWEGQAMRVVVNGFGRIGRSVLRAWLQGGWPDIEIVGINDIAAANMCAYLFEYDSVFGVWTGSVTLEDGALVLNGRRIALTREPDLSVLDLSGVDVVMECTGRADRAEMAGRALTAGARRVLVSGPSAAAGVTVVLGANEAQLGAHRIVSNASCTTNALAPLARLLDKTFGGCPGGGFCAQPGCGAVDGTHHHLGAAPAGYRAAPDCGADRRLGGAGAGGFGFRR